MHNFVIMVQSNKIPLGVFFGALFDKYSNWGVKDAKCSDYYLKFQIKSMIIIESVEEISFGVIENLKCYIFSI